jgi:hypothetical protein
MKTLSLLILAIFLHADTFITKQGSSMEKKDENKKVKCHIVCDKKAFMEESIKQAVDFYKTSPYHTFSKRD